MPRWCHFSRLNEPLPSPLQVLKEMAGFLTSRHKTQAKWGTAFILHPPCTRIRLHPMLFSPVRVWGWAENIDRPVIQLQGCVGCVWVPKHSHGDGEGAEAHTSPLWHVLGLCKVGWVYLQLWHKRNGLFVDSSKMCCFLVALRLPAAQSHLFAT